jgi:hypothetical protein
VPDQFALGAVVPLEFRVLDADGDLAAPGGAVLTITLPDGTTSAPSLTSTETGIYTCDYTAPAAGRYTARFVSSGVNAGAIEDVFDVMAPTLAQVGLDAVRAYLGEAEARHDDETLARILAAEQSAQRARCRLDPYAPDLAEALLRRVQRNIAMSALPIGITEASGDAGNRSYVPGSDPEIRRLEAPYRRLVVG